MSVDTGFISLSDLWPVVEAEPYKHLFMTISGSHQYGFSSHDSDIDLRGVHLLPVQEIAGLHKGPTTIEHTTENAIPIDVVTHDVAKFCNLLLSKNGNVLENLYSPLVVTTTLAHEELKYLASLCITRYHCKHYRGFADKQWHLLQKEHQRNKKGVKALLYLYRVMLTGIHMMQTGRVEAHLLTLNSTFHLPYLPDLIARKLAGSEHESLTEQEVALHTSEYHRLCEMLENAFLDCRLPEKVSGETEQLLHEFVLKIRGI